MLTSARSPSSPVPVPVTPTRPQRWSRPWAVYGFFGSLLLLGLGIYADYGISWDEDLSRATGMVNLRYLAEQVWPDLAIYHRDGTYPPLHEWVSRDYGALFETPAALIERLLHLEDAGDRYRLRHLLTFLVCFGGVVAVYKLGKQRFGDWRIGLLGAMWLVLSPRLFAESFYNSKDAVFTALFAIAMHTAVRLVLRPTLRRALWHALACAAAIDVRIMAVLLPVVSLGLLALRTGGGRVAWRTTWPVAGLYSSVLGGLVVAFWPYLWAAPLTNLLLAFRHMSAYWWNNTVLYRGEFVPATQLPWHYALVWIGITTPVLYLSALGLSLLATLGRLGRDRWPDWVGDESVQDLFFVALLGLPLLAVITLKSVLYDGWRHLYFVYPALLLLALRGWVAAWRWLAKITAATRWQFAPGAWLIATALSMAAIAAQMIEAHPNQQVYFNFFAGADVAQRYELDYWGLSFRQGLEYIAAHDHWARIKVMANDPVLPVAKLNLSLLPPDDRQRLTFTESAQQADYFITNYRWHPGPYPYRHEVYRIRIGAARILSVFKLSR